ncbi:zinc finger protein 1035 [Chanos chanos]|uniref:Zinc finger protein 1035 n=1 Tax=Chanos chanos TaxID=29144 RepID=A0A6J2W705_CHACN|nr:zinc finger protein 135-like [Chanos chanos]
MSSKHMVEQGVDFNSASENVVCEDSQKDPLDNCSREEEPSSFAFLESCFGFKNSEHDSKIIPQHANLNLNEETDISEGREANQGSQGNRPCNAESPIVVKSGCESISRDQDKKEADGEKTRLLSVFYNKIPSSLVPEMQSEQIGSTSATEEQNGDTTSTETQNESGITRKSITPLLSCQKLQKKLQPVVLLKTKEPCTKERMFHCAKCKETAQSLDQLIEHHHGTHPNTDFQYCLTCGFYFTNDSFAWQHLCNQTEQNGYHLSRPTQLHANSSLERPNAKYKCEYCGKPFFKRIRKEEHEHRHRTVTPHRCDNCGLYFTQFGTLNRHKKRVQCFPLIMAPNKQSEVTSNTSLLKESVTPLVDTSLSKLLDCFVKLVDCMKNQIPLPITCQVCGRSFRLRAQLNTHLRTHANEKPFECSACLKAFKYPWNLKRHKREQCTGHSISQEGSSLMENKTQGQFKCPICPRMFKQSYTRLRHLREQCLKEYTRTGSGKVNNRYKCPLCNQTFSLASNRSRHIRIVCFKQYKLLGNSQTNKEAQEDLAELVNLQQHERSHKSEFQCQVCNRGFVSLFALLGQNIGKSTLNRKKNSHH